jgi:hypothetical protein
MRRPVLYLSQILAWMDDFHERTGRWPRRDDGRIGATIGETWQAVNIALQKGWRGLPRGSSLAQLLAEYRGVRNPARLPHFTITQILRWADAHYRRTGQWPMSKSGPILEAPGETWLAVQKALYDGKRGLRGGSSLAQLLAKHRGVRNPQDLPRLSYKQILAWADAHYARTGSWPTLDSGPIHDACGETWSAVSTALVDGLRGLPGGSSLARLLAKHRGVRNRKDLPKLRIATIVSWADAYYRRTGTWPKHISGPIPEAPGETWAGMEAALKVGLRGLPGGSSLFQLLHQYRNVRRRYGRNGYGTAS